MPRTSLNTDVSTYAPRTYVNVDVNTGDILDSSQDIVEVSRVTKVRETVNTPGFREKSKGTLPMNPFSYTEYVERKPVGRMIVTNSVSRATTAGRLSFVDFDGSLSITEGDKASADQQALYKGLSGLKDGTIDLGVAVGERRETARLLLNSAGAVGNVIRDLKRGDFFGASRHLGLSKPEAVDALGRNPRKRRDVFTPASALSNGWLALQFGVKPLIQDVQGAVEALALAGTTKRVYARKGKRHSFSSNRTVLWNNVPAVRSESGFYQRSYTFVYKVDNEGLVSLSELGLTNLYSLAYELTTLSFVVDYFINIGGYIDLWDATSGLSFEKGCTTSFLKAGISGVCNGSAIVGGQLYEVTGAGSYEVVEVRRTVLTDFPTPTLPLLNPRLTPSKVTSMVALVHQRLKR